LTTVTGQAEVDHVPGHRSHERGGQLAGTLPAKHDDVALALGGDAGDALGDGAQHHQGFMGDPGGVEQRPCRRQGIAAAGFLHGFDLAQRHVAEHLRRVDRRLHVEQHDVAGDAVLASWMTCRATRSECSEPSTGSRILMAGLSFSVRREV
jgi:hypothetical protein